MQDVDKMLSYLSELTSFFTNIKNNNGNSLPVINSQPTAPVINSQPTVNLSNSKEFDKLKNLLMSSDWPQAVEPEHICDENVEEQVADRADAIIQSIIPINLGGKVFLDYGCGQGAIAAKIAEMGAVKSVGFDIEKRWKDGTSKAILTTSLNEVRANAPYNLVLLYDVLDHVIHESPVDVLKNIHELLTNDGIIVVRNHPWTAPHATHVYRNINKAYLHIVFNDDEIKMLGAEGEPTIKMIHPRLTYQKWFNEAKLKITKENAATKDTIDPFFMNNTLVSGRIKSRFIHSHEPALASGKLFPEFQLKTHFIDFNLSKQ